MNTYQHKPMPYGAKLAKLYDSAFYLSQAHCDVIRERMEIEKLNERDLIHYIDDHGEWLDS